MSDYFDDHAVKIDGGGFKDAVDKLETLLDEEASENVLQKHLETHPYILSQQFAHCHHVFPKVALGVQYETDFMCLDVPSSGKEWIAVELESSTKKVITRSGRKTAELEHAIQQIRDWRAWMTESLSYARQNREHNGLGLNDITPRFFGYVVIGRRKFYNDKFNDLRRQIFRDELITVQSWDGIVECARKRAAFFSTISDFFGVIKKQQELIILKNKIADLKGLITEIKHSEELIVEQKKKICILEQQYRDELLVFGSTLPKTLVGKIGALLKTNTPLPSIITTVKEEITDEIPEALLQEYIVKVMVGSDN